MTAGRAIVHADSADRGGTRNRGGPTAWPVIRGTGGARKARAARGGRGKSGGVRIIYFVVSRRGVIYLIDIYAKSEKENLTDAERREIHKLVVALEAEE
jgi:hypothetical protein